MSGTTVSEEVESSPSAKRTPSPLRDRRSRNVALLLMGLVVAGALAGGVLYSVAAPAPAVAVQAHSYHSCAVNGVNTTCASLTVELPFGPAGRA